MDEETLKIIRNTPYIYDFLREDSSHYKELFRNKDYIKKVDSLAKEKYKLSMATTMQSETFELPTPIPLPQQGNLLL